MPLLLCKLQPENHESIACEKYLSETLTLILSYPLPSDEIGQDMQVFILA
jgi:hypothetical protein